MKSVQAYNPESWTQEVEQRSHGCDEQTHISCGVRARSPADWSLVNVDDFIDLINALNFQMLPRSCLGFVQDFGYGFIQDIQHERGLA